MFYFRAIIVVCVFLLANNTYGQSTYEQVRQIFVSKCSIACHGNSLNGFNISASAQDLYDELINGVPKNQAAAARSYRLISPGRPDKSYLMRKVANCISADLAMDPLLGAPMPQGGAPLLDEEIELIRQWILFGAPYAGQVVDKTIVDDYYQNGGIPKIERPNPPKSCEGFQIHFGPILFEPGKEAEYYLRYDLDLADTLEVIGMEVLFNNESHHFILEKYPVNEALLWPQGLVELTPTTVLSSNKLWLMAWQANEPYDLPNGTAFFWYPGEALELNFHLANHTGEILPGEVYLNIYTEPKGNAVKELQSALIPNYSIILPDSETTVIEYEVLLQGASLASITPHTHRTGIDFDVYFRNADGSKGEMIYNGSYNYQQGFDTGAYDWDHPSVAFYKPFLDMRQPINQGNVPTGLIMQATYRNNTADTLYFGETTKDEMMVLFIQYVDSTYAIPGMPPWVPQCNEVYTDPCKGPDGTTHVTNVGVAFNVYPNPTVGGLNIDFALLQAAEVRVELYDMLGERVQTLIPPSYLPAGSHTNQTMLLDAAQGVYFVRVWANGTASTQKVVLLKGH